MLARSLAGAVLGIEGRVIRVEADLSRGLPGMTIVWLPDVAIQESRERVRSAIRNSGLTFPLKRMTINLAPAALRKAGGVFDLAIACAVLAASEQLPAGVLDGTVLWGELGLDGTLRAVPGVLPLAADLARLGYERLIVPVENGAEAGLIPGLEIRQAESLHEVVAALRGEEALRTAPRSSPDLDTNWAGPDMADVRGQPVARRAVEIAAAGNHNLVLVGPPGSGKSMLAARVPSILPPLTLAEALEVTRIHSVAGKLPADQPWVARRPFRTPHHTASDISLIGGGSMPRPGEASLAHRGVLFLDEMLEFRRSALEVLRQPMVDGTVVISRAQAVLHYPARFCLVGTFNPCPCGFLGDEERPCSCSPRAIERYRSRLSGPLLDRIDLQVTVPRLGLAALASDTDGEGSVAIRQRVVAARLRQSERLGVAGTNGEMTPPQVRETCSLARPVRHYLDRHARVGRLTARAYEKVIKVARTVADLEAAPAITERHVAEAISYRSLDLQERLAA
jgi:magnesium chelatase family protein